MRAWEFIASSSAREVSVVKDTAVREVEVELRAIAGYVAVEYDGKWWIACVDEIFPHSNEVSVNFLYPHGPSPSYFYPRRPDSLVVDVDDILVQLSPTTVTGRTYHLSEDDTDWAIIALQLEKHLSILKPVKRMNYEFVLLSNCALLILKIVLKGRY